MVEISRILDINLMPLDNDLFLSFTLYYFECIMYALYIMVPSGQNRQKNTLNECFFLLIWHSQTAFSAILPTGFIYN